MRRAYRRAYLSEIKFLVVIQGHNQTLLLGQVIDRRRYALL
jgi:hypothetical protein